MVQIVLSRSQRGHWSPGKVRQPAPVVVTELPFLITPISKQKRYFFPIFEAIAHIAVMSSGGFAHIVVNGTRFPAIVQDRFFEIRSWSSGVIMASAAREAKAKAAIFYAPPPSLGQTFSRDLRFSIRPILTPIESHAPALAPACRCPRSTACGGSNAKKNVRVQSGGGARHDGGKSPSRRSHHKGTRRRGAEHVPEG